MDLKKPLSISEQVNRLEEHGMTVRSKREAENVLSYINYYRLTGYALQFRDENGQDYIQGTDFDTVREIYRFDEAMRALLRKPLDIVEGRYRTKIAYGFSIEKCKEPPHDGHYIMSNFVRPDDIQEVLFSLEKEEERRPDSLVVLHHKNAYQNKMPLWVMVELLSMSSLSLMYHAMYFSEQDSIANLCGQTREVFSNHLHALTVLRNKCSHGARLYGTTFNPPVQLSPYYLKKHKEVSVNSLFAVIIALMKNLPDRSDKVELQVAVCNCIRRYAGYIDLAQIGFPDNYIALLGLEVNS